MNAPSRMKRLLRLFPRSVNVSFGLLLVLSTSFYSAAQQPDPKRDRRGPPPEAFAACKSAAQNDACSLEMPSDTVTGTCQFDRRQQTVLLCVPTDKRPDDRTKFNPGESEESPRAKRPENDQ